MLIVFADPYRIVRIANHSRVVVDEWLGSLELLLKHCQVVPILLVELSCFVYTDVTFGFSESWKVCLRVVPHEQEFPQLNHVVVSPEACPVRGVKGLLVKFVDVLVQDFVVARGQQEDHAAGDGFHHRHETHIGFALQVVGKVSQEKEHPQRWILLNGRSKA